MFIGQIIPSSITDTRLLLFWKDAIKVSHTAGSGVAVITVEQNNGNNNIVIIPGANEEISIDDIKEAHGKGLIGEKVMECQFEVSPTEK